MKTRSLFIRALVSFSIFVSSAVLAVEPPGILNHQGRIAVSGANYTGTGHFKFALVDGAGTTTLWSNDGSGTGGGQPTAAVQVAVSQGHYALGLGDTALANMTAAIPASVFTGNADVRLRVWFSANGTTFEQLTPDRRITAAGYALTAGAVADPSFVGTTTNTSLDLSVNNVRALRLQGGFTTGTFAPNLIGGDAGNTITLGSYGCVIAGGGLGGTSTNSITNNVSAATIAGGKDNIASQNDTFIGGGAHNRASGLAATVAGGNTNIASGSISTVGGGQSNTANGFRATVPGGDNNTASGPFSFAAGRQARAINDGAFVWADSQPAPFSSTRATTSSSSAPRAASGSVRTTRKRPWMSPAR